MLEMGQALEEDEDVVLVSPCGLVKTEIETGDVLTCFRNSPEVFCERDVFRTI